MTRKTSDRLPEQRARQAEDPDGYYEHRKQHYRSAAMAGMYDATRFSGRRRRRHLREERVLLRTLDDARLYSLIGPSPTILDIPAGTGRFLPALKAWGARCLSADISREMLLEAKKRAEQDEPMLVMCDAASLPLKDDCVEAVISIRFFFHIPTAVRITMLREFRRVSRGCIIVEYRRADSLPHLFRVLLHKIGLRHAPQPRVSMTDIVHELEAAGLRLVGTYSVVPVFSDKLLVVARRPAGRQGK